MQGRIWLFPFDISFKGNEDTTRPDELTKESEGIFTLWVRESVAYYREGLLRPDAVQAASQAFLATANTAGQFWQECISVTRNIANKITAQELHNIYDGWCAGELTEPMDIKPFVEALRSQVPVIKKPKNKLTFYGIKYTAPPEDVEDAYAEADSGGQAAMTVRVGEVLQTTPLEQFNRENPDFEWPIN